MINSFEFSLDTTSLKPEEQEISEIIKTPKEILTDAINDPEINGDALLDVFEEYIKNNEYYDDKFDRQNIFYRLGLKIISDEDFNPSIVIVESSDDPKLKGFPDIIKRHVELSDEGAWGHEQYRYIPEDNKWARLMRLMSEHEKKILDIALANPNIFIEKGASWESEDDKFERFKDNFQGHLSYMYDYLVSEVREKEIGEDLLASGDWLGHGTFISNLENMLNNGGMLKSPYRILNSGQPSETVFGDFSSGPVHKALIFFFHLRNENPNLLHARPAGRYATHAKGIIEVGDLGIFFPTDVIYNNGLTFGSWCGKKSTSEFFATKSSELISGIKNGVLSSEQIVKVAENDKSELPLSEAFYRVDDLPSFEKVKRIFSEFGFSDDWVTDHTFLDSNDYSGKKLENWLKTRTYERVSIPKLKPKLIGNNFYVWESENTN